MLTRQILKQFFMCPGQEDSYPEDRTLARCQHTTASLAQVILAIHQSTPCLPAQTVVHVYSYRMNYSSSILVYNHLGNQRPEERAQRHQ